MEELTDEGHSNNTDIIMEDLVDEGQSSNTVSVVDNPAQDEGTDEIVQSLPRLGLDDNGQRNWQEESRQYLDVHFPNWKDPKNTHMVPIVPPVCRPDAHQSTSSGAEAENKIFNLIKDFGQKYSEPMFVVHSCEFAALVENAEKGYCYREWAKGECDFVVIHRRLGLFFIEVKAGKSRSVYETGRKQIGKVKQAVVSYCKKIFQGKKKAIEKEIFKYPGFVALPNCSKEESYDCGLFREDCQDVESFKKWWDQKIVRSDGGEICPDIYEALAVRFVALIHKVAPTLDIQIENTHHRLTCILTPKQLEVMLDSCPKQWITGPAGSGKTVLLILKVKEVISSIMKKGKNERVLVLCYNRALSVFLKNDISAWFKNKYNAPELPPEICTIKTYHSFLWKLGDFKTFPLQMSEISIIENKYRDESPRDEDMYNHIFCDEGQDFPGCWTELLERFLKEDPHQDKEPQYYFWVMFDSCQHVHFSGQERPFWQSLKQAYRLIKVMRNTEKIFLESKRFFVGFFKESIKLGHTEIGLNVQFDDSLLEDKSNSVNVISKRIDWLLTEKVEKKDIIVLTRDKETRNVLINELIDLRKAYEIEDAELRLKSGNNCISVDSIRRFKGLESKVVIVYDPEYSAMTNAGYTSKARELLYVAMSRCFCYLVIVSTKEGCRTIKSGNLLPPKEPSAERMGKNEKREAPPDQGPYTIDSAQSMKVIAATRKQTERAASYGPPERKRFKGRDEEEHEDPEAIESAKFSTTSMEETQALHQHDTKVLGINIIEPGDTYINDNIRGTTFAQLTECVKSNVTFTGENVSEEQVATCVKNIEYQYYQQYKPKRNSKDYIKQLRKLRREIESKNKQRSPHQTVLQALHQ